MNFIEIKEGVSLRKSSIISVEKVNDKTIRVETDKHMYTSSFSYETILKILEADDSNKYSGRWNGTGNNQHFAG